MKTILFVEDQPELRDLLSQHLKDKGYQVLTATSGEEGMTHMRSDHPDLVLLDLILPHMDGFQVLEEKSRDATIAAIPVIALTNRDDPAAIERATSYGARAYLIKTNYSLDEVMEKVEAVLGESHP